jgi:hypothetical protein
MSEWPPDRTAVDALRRAWAAADEEAAPGASGAAEIDADRIWRAAAGELPPAEVQALADLAARDPAVAQAWRLARELQAAMPAAESTRRGGLLRFPGAAGAPLRWALVATLAVALGTGLWLRLGPHAGETTLRGGEAVLAIAPGVPDGAELSRRNLVLRWTPLPDPEARYTLRLTTGNLALLAEARDLPAAEYRVPPQALAGVPAGNTLLWQVDGRLPDGRVVSSSTSRLILRD